MFNKSSSCQRLTHMRKLYNIPPHEAKSARIINVYDIFDKDNDYYNNRNNLNKENRIHLKNIFKSTKQSIIKNKIRILSKFSIFPDYKVRKIDLELKKIYAHNNLHIIGGIREQLEQNIQKKEEKQTPSTTKLQNELLQKQKEDIKKNLKKILMLMIYYKLNYYYNYWFTLNQ